VTWTHQDEETTVGEDTLSGISKFIHTAKDKVKYGAGFIIYCLDYTIRPSQIQEMSRTSDDYRVMLSLSTKTNPLVGFHGSHFIIRATTEDEIGWDFGKNSIAEDMIFENVLRTKYKGSFMRLNGFAYEKAPLNIKEQIKQRRRWTRAGIYAEQNKSVSKAKKLVIAYSTFVWFGSMASVASLFATAFTFVSGYYPITLPIAGYVWVQMVNNYYDGYLFHKNYIPNDKSIKKLKRSKLIVNGIAGAFIDAIAPWYALKKQKQNIEFEVLDKDILLRK